jgi:hypothetical protein
MPIGAFRRRRRWSRSAAAAALALLAALVLAGPAQSATDQRPYPRTYHIWGGWSGTDVLAKYDMVVGYANYDVAWLRSKNPGALYFLSPGLYPENPSSYGLTYVTYGAIDQWKGGCDNYTGGVNLGCIRAFNSYWDFLYNANGTIAGRDNGTSNHSGWNLADPTGKGTPDLIAKVMAYSAKKGGLYSKGWDGIHSDNWAFTIGENWLYGKNLDTDRNGQVDDYTALRRNWSNGLVKVGHTLRSHLTGKTVGGNGIWYKNPGADQGTEPDGWLRSANYTMIEHFDRYFGNPDEAIATARRWLSYSDPYGQPRYVATIHRAQKADGSLYCLSSGVNPNQNAYMTDPTVMKSMRWGLTLALMADIYYELYVGCPVMHHTRWWYDEYDGGEGVRRAGYLGRALGGPVEIADNVYRRDFENGVVINNSTGTSRTVDLGGAFRKLRGTQNPTLNNGATVTSVTVPGKDGIILLRTTGSGELVAPASVAPPAISGVPAQGSTLTASDGSWSGTTPLAYAYQWQRCDAAGAACSAVAGATGKTYVPTASDVGATLRVVVTATNSAGSDQATSAPTAAVTAGGFQVAHVGVGDGQTVAGQVYWAATATGATVKRVEFLVDGSLRWTEYSAPYEFNSGSTTRWDTTKEADGVHTLVAKAYAGDGRTVALAISVNVANASSPPPAPTSTGFTVANTGVADGQSVSGRVYWSATASGATVSKVEFLVDGQLRWTEWAAPYDFKTTGVAGWDTTKETNGAHTLTAKAYATDGRTVSATVTVTVANGSAPSPAPTSGFVAAHVGLVDGERVGGSVYWAATASGATVSKVEFLIDGRLRWTERVAPYEFNTGGNTRWNTQSETNGLHTLTVKAYASDGRTTSSTIAVTVAN